MVTLKYYIFFFLHYIFDKKIVQAHRMVYFSNPGLNLSLICIDIKIALMRALHLLLIFGTLLTVSLF